MGIDDDMPILDDSDVIVLEDDVIYGDLDEEE
jgi:hypothetical protein